ncbi:MAG: Gfo/Idh/MocA family oxidoreductase [Dehalococcoidia bacterium]
MTQTSGKKTPVLGVGVIGLGGAAVAMVPKFAANPGFRIAGAADIDQEVLDRFKQDFPDANVYLSAEDLCNDPQVNLIYIATPNKFHMEHARMALEGKKHVLVEKPMTVTIEDSEVMINTAERNGVLLGVNVKHSFEPRILRMREMVRTGEFGRLRMINHWRYQDWLYRPRTPEELTPGPGGGILWRQGAHQFDFIRTIAGGMVRTVRGQASVWDPSRRVPGAHVAYLEFEDDVFVTAVYTGADHWDSRELVQGVGREGVFPDPKRHASARRELSKATDPDWEASAARAERYGLGRSSGQGGGGQMAGGGSGWILGGPFIASFDDADVRMTPGGLVVYGNEERTEIPLATEHDGRDGRINTFYDAIVGERPLPADGRWGLGTLEVILGIEESGRQRKEIYLTHQVPTVD